MTGDRVAQALIFFHSIGLQSGLDDQPGAGGESNEVVL